MDFGGKWSRMTHFLNTVVIAFSPVSILFTQHAHHLGIGLPVRIYFNGLIVAKEKCSQTFPKFSSYLNKCPHMPLQGQLELNIKPH